MKASWNGAVLAESDETIVVEGNHYFPPDSIHKEYFVESDSHMICSWKGVASYYDIQVESKTNRNAAWYYPEPQPAAEKIAGYIAFWHGVRVHQEQRMGNPGEIPVLTTSQMVEVDRMMIEAYQIELIQMMENAGRNLAELVRRELGGKVTGKYIACLCGADNNGGGGLVAARHLHNWGAEIGLVLAYETSRLKEIPAHQLNILTRMGADTSRNPNLTKADLVIDALIGYGLRGDPREPVAGQIEKANISGAPIIALDAPSGLDTTSGVPGNPCIRSKATLTLALPKTGLITGEVKDYVGELYLADISVPVELYQRMGIEVPNLFVEDTILKVDLGSEGV